LSDSCGACPSFQSSAAEIQRVQMCASFNSFQQVSEKNSILMFQLRADIGIVSKVEMPKLRQFFQYSHCSGTASLCTFKTAAA